MKRITLLLFATTVYIYPQIDPYPQPPIASRTSMYVHPIFQNIAMDKSLWHTALFNKDHKFAFQITGFYQKGFFTDHIKQFFLPQYRTQLYVDSSSLNRDVNPFWIGLPSDFSGYLTISPSYQSSGFRMEARRMVGDLFDIPFLSNSWVAISTPFTINKQNINLSQSNVQNQGSTADPVYDILTAFNNETWLFDKMAYVPAKKTFAEVRIAYGTTIFSNGRAYAVTYSALSIPTTKKPSNEFLFQTQVGNDAHLGVMWGFSLQLPMNRASDSYQVNLHIDLENTYLMKDHRYRTFDLKEKDWSRFLQLRSIYEPFNVTIPGVNILTQKVMVAPHHTTDFDFGVRVQSKGLEAEVGFGIWAHAGDKIRFTEPWQNIYGIAGSMPLTTASTSTIAVIGPDDAAFVPIIISDLNISSGSMPPVMVFKAYGTVGYTHRAYNHDFLFGGGFFAESPHHKVKAMMIWGTHFKFGFGF